MLLPSRFTDPDELWVHKAPDTACLLVTPLPTSRVTVGREKCSSVLLPIFTKIFFALQFCLARWTVLVWRCHCCLPISNTTIMLFIYRLWNFGNSSSWHQLINTCPPQLLAVLPAIIIFIKSSSLPKLLFIFSWRWRLRAERAKRIVKRKRGRVWPLTRRQKTILA